MGCKQFGGKITPQRKLDYEQSPNWREGCFQNLVKTETALNWRKIPGVIYRQFKGTKGSTPAKPLAVIPFNPKEFFKEDGQTKFVWYGHSVVLMRLNGQTLLIDPMFGHDASPIAPKKTRRFSHNTLNLIEALPEIDLVLITHDHYDHLDFQSILRLKSKAKRFFVALGVKRHLESWGINGACIDEFDWWENRSFNGMEITFTPTRHFSGRGLSSLSKCLWGGWVFRTSSENIWFSGDGGYGEHFKEVGNRLGPFDFGMMECGQYCDDWPQIHLFPEECVKAALDAQVKKAMPLHWAGFSLSYQHAWFEPAEKFSHFAALQSLSYITPQIGEIFQLTSPTHHWWKNYL